MEKHVKQRPKPVKLQQRITLAMIFQNHHNPFSPSKNRHYYNPKKFSSPIVSRIPEDVRRKLTTNYKNTDHEEGGGEEPISPKVSCIGQIKQKKKDIKKKKTKKRAAFFSNKTEAVKIKKIPCSSRMLCWRSNSDASNYGSCNIERQPVVNDPEKAPSLGQLKRFTSGRESLKNFDWMAE